MLLVELWQEKVGNYIQVLHVNAGIGSVLAPLIARPFLLPVDEETYSREGRFTPDDVRVQWSFLIIGSISVITGIAFLPYYFDDVKRQKLIVKINESLKTSPKESEETPFSTLKIYTAVLWVAVMATFNWSIETTICKSISLHCFRDLECDRGQGRKTVFWISKIII